MSGRYYFQRQLYWNQIHDAHGMCLQMNPGDLTLSEDASACIEKKEKKLLNILLALNQATVLET